MLTLDMALTFFMSASVFAFAVAQHDSGESERRRWMLVAWAAAALAVMTKGLVGIVLPAGAVAAYVLLHRDWRLLSRLHLVQGASLFLAIAAPWFILASLANPEFFRFFFIHEHFERFLPREHDRYQPFWYFIPVLLLGILPWLVGLFPALRLAWTRSAAAGFHTQRFLLLWCAVVLVFFSASNSKLASYILPFFPALSLLVGNYLCSAPRRVLLAQAVLASLLGIAVALASPQAVRFASESLPSQLVGGYVPWIAAARAFLAARRASRPRGVRNVQRKRPRRVPQGAPGPHADRRARPPPRDREKAVNAASWALIFTGVLLNAAAQLLLKAGTNAVGQFEFSAQNIVPVGMKLALEPHIAGGVACYVVSLVVWIMGLSRIEVSIAYPMLSIGYVLNAVAAWYLFGESLTAQKLLGIAFIVAGVFLVARS